jgi:mono/diheme cytochrome c family protein
MTSGKRLVRVVLAVVVLGAIVAIGGVVFLRSRAEGFSARSNPTAIEEFAAQTARRLALPSGAKERLNPVPNTQENVDEAMAHWADHCAVCHGNDGTGDGTMGKQMYPHAPDMRQERTQKLSDGELFYIIENGVRLTGMPAWGGSQVNEAASWKLVHFIRHLPKLTASERLEMEKLNPQSPEDIEREQQEEQFLNQQAPDESQEKKKGKKR